MMRSLPLVLALSGLLPPLVAFGVYLAHGTPHLAVRYSFLDNGDEWNVHAPRYYTSCTYLGLTGEHEVAAQSGYCPWVKFFKAEGAS